jgi:protein-tyrosine phosphatase
MNRFYLEYIYQFYQNIKYIQIIMYIFYIHIFRNKSHMSKNSPHAYSNATEILPGLWLGDINAANDSSFFKDKQIQCIINCTDRHPFSDDPIIEIRYRLAIKDNLENEEIIKLYESLDNVVDTIHTHIRSYNLLVHCFAGRQRSSSIILAYLMKYGHLKLQLAIVALKSKKPDVFEPQFNFERALIEYEKQLGGNLGGNPHNPLHTN